jgi:hypothetical protein
MDSLISEIKIFDENEMDKTRTFRERLLLIQKRAQESRKESILYKNIKERIETNCERAAYENRRTAIETSNFNGIVYDA